MKFLAVFVVLAFLGIQTLAGDTEACDKFNRRGGRKGGCKPKTPACHDASCLPAAPSCKEGFNAIWVFKKYKCVPICEPPKVPFNGKCVLLQKPPCFDLKCPCSCVKGGSGKRDCFGCLKDKFAPAK
eukprot:TRINITY_DN4576_c0_g1_i2.p2 TRINITY_DN4576_c0_g1~~TRINITY_DN4576_c0_g1_i2.p2  ORF type:complete len:127 (+),score=19.15 TRINITY_DN4576_c0_g1_i2:283-663(+)